MYHVHIVQYSTQNTISICHQLYVSKTAVAGLLVNRELSIIHVSFWGGLDFEIFRVLGVRQNSHINK